MAEHVESVLAPAAAVERELDHPLVLDSRVSRAIDTTVSSSLPMSTGSVASRASSASSREASEISVIRRSRRCTSCLITPSSRARCSSVLRDRQRLDRAPERGQRVLQLVRDVGGEALDRLHALVERARHVRENARQMPDLVLAAAEIGDLRTAMPDAAPHPLGGGGEPAHRAGDRAGEQDGQEHGDGRGDQEHAQDRHALALHDVVDVARFGGEEQAAEDGAVALHRDRHRDDQPAVLADPHDARSLAVQRRWRPR